MLTIAIEQLLYDIQHFHAVLACFYILGIIDHFYNILVIYKGMLKIHTVYEFLR